MIDGFGEIALGHGSGFAFGVFEVLASLLEDFAEFEGDGGGGRYFVVSVEFGDFGVIGSGEGVVPSSWCGRSVVVVVVVVVE